MKKLIKKISLLKDNNQKGASSVEFAIVILLFITIIFGIIEFGLYMYNQHIVTNAAREGVRYGVVYRDNRISANDIEAEVRSYTDNYLVTFGGGTATVNSGVCAGSGELLSVTVSYNYNFLFLRSLARQISSTTSMRCE